MAEMSQHFPDPVLVGTGEALLLDRDGVINIDKGYVAKRADFEWQPGIFRLLATAASHRIPVIVVTNQTGIGRGYYTQRDFDDLTCWMCAEFERRGTPLARVYHCAHHPESHIPELRAHHPWRKPEPGMIEAARREFNLDLARCVMVGDQWTDMQAAERAGVGTAILVGQPRPPAPSLQSAVIRLPDVTAVAEWYANRCADYARAQAAV